MKTGTTTPPIFKLQKLLLDGGDICVPLDEDDPWLLLDKYEEELSEGETLEQAAEGLTDKKYDT